MEKYIFPVKKTNYGYMLWISALLLIFNVYHAKLISMVLFSSVAFTLLLQGFAVALLIMYFVIDKKLNLTKVEIQSFEWLLILSSLVMLVTTERYGENLTYIVRYAVLILIVILMKYDEKTFSVIFYCILAAGIIHVIATLWFYFDTDFYMQNIYPHFDTNQKAHLYAQVNQNNHAVGLASHYSQNGIYMAISLCSAYTLFSIKPQKKVWWKVAFFVLVLFSLVLTGKRGVLLFSVFAILVSYVISKKGAFANKVIIVLFAASALSIVMYVLSFYVEGIAAAFDRFTLMFSNENETFDASNGRFKLYGVALDFFKESPILGIGWREFSKEVVVFYNQDSVLRDAHNVFLQLLCETGIVGFTVFVTLFFSAIVNTIQLVVKCTKNKLELSTETKGALVFSLCYQIFFLSYCITGNPLYDLETVYVYIISVGFSSGIYYNHREEIVKNKWLQKHSGSKYIK